MSTQNEAAPGAQEPADPKAPSEPHVSFRRAALVAALGPAAWFVDLSTRFFLVEFGFARQNEGWVIAIGCVLRRGYRFRPRVEAPARARPRTAGRGRVRRAARRRARRVLGARDRRQPRPSRLPRRGLTAVSCLATVSTRLAHPGESHDAALPAPARSGTRAPASAGPGGLGPWTFDPLVIGALLIVATVYALGTRRLWQRRGRHSPVGARQLVCMIAGWLALIIALLSPLDSRSDLSFAAHMTQHELLMLVAAPLLVLGRPLVVVLWALPPEARRRAGQALTQGRFARSWRTLSGPVVALFLHALAVWLWHLPALFDAALAHEPVHAVQHLSFFATAALFWWAIVHGRYGRLGYGLSVLFVFATALHQSVLGALLTLARVAWYPLAADRARSSGLDPLEDQQLAGLLMWVPSGVLFAILGLALFSAWLGDIERRARRRREARY